MSETDPQTNPEAVAGEAPDMAGETEPVAAVEVAEADDEVADNTGEEKDEAAATGDGDLQEAQDATVDVAAYAESSGARAEGEGEPVDVSKHEDDDRVESVEVDAEVDAEVDVEVDAEDLDAEDAEVEDEGSEEEQAAEENELEEDRPDPLQELTEKLEQLLEINERYVQTSGVLQKKVIQRKMADKSHPDATEKLSEGRVTEHKYQNLLKEVHSIRLQLRLQQVRAARMSDELKTQLEAKRQKAIECRDSFQEFKRQVARHAEYARTGKKIPEKIIQEVEEFELDKDAEVEEVRGSNISLKNRLAKLEQMLRKKDELAENLHVIDFEQLKIENQTLNEKIEERNEELHKLRKKTIVYVQITTHMREKVQFVQQEFSLLKAELANLEQDLAAQRDNVAKTKHDRDDYRLDNAKQRNTTGIVNSEQLSKDYEARAQTIEQLKKEIASYKKRHAQMTAYLKSQGVD